MNSLYMSTFPLVFEPNPMLHKVASPVEVIDESIKQLGLDMIETMLTESGVGLAAPQIGMLKRMFVVSHREGAKIIINPEIYWRSWRKEVDEEGCLSIPGVYGPVRRSRSIKIKYTDENGQKHDIKAMGFFARVIQHEFDHIEGVLFTEKLVR